MCSRADPRRNHGLCAAHGAQRSSGSIFRGGKSSPSAFGGDLHSLSDRIHRGNRLLADCTGTTERDLIGGAPLDDVSRQTTRLVIEISNSGHTGGFDTCRTRVCPPTLPEKHRRFFVRRKICQSLASRLHLLSHLLSHTLPSISHRTLAYFDLN